MMFRLLITAFAITLSAAPGATAAQDKHHMQSDFTAADYKERRSRIFDQIGDNAIALVQGASGVQDLGSFRQSNEFYYLTGLEVPHAYLLMDGRRREATIYLPHRDPERERVEGKLLSAEDGKLVAALTGADHVRGVEALSKDLVGSGLVRPPAPLLFTPLSPSETDSRDDLLVGQADVSADPWNGTPSREGRLKLLINGRFPQFEVRDLTPTLDSLRTVKSAKEIGLIRRATQLAGLAIIEAMRSTEPGVYEYQLDAVAKYLYFLNGARGEGYASIVGGGQNAWMGHYFRKSDQLRAGEMVLMDYAPDYRYYTSDVTRMWPVSGRFDPDQRALAEFILAYRDALFRHVKPGVTSDQVLDAAARDMEKYLLGRTFRKPAHAAAVKAALTFRGHFQHAVGMSVHDVGVVRGVPLQPGMVFTIDPMIWVPEEKLYIRIEDVALVTPGGVENLSSFVPSEPAAIEQTMREKGIIQMHGPSEQIRGLGR